MATNDGFSGVSNCYVFKSRLQEYAQKVGLPTPIYETIKEGPSHEPSFRSTVIVNDVRYDSLPGFFNRKAAEQSAAEVALLELAKSGELDQSISQPVHETGLCKNLLQEYAQKMNYAIPIYQCQKDEAPGRMPRFSCNVEIGGIKYIGAAARTKKEAEIKAARTALIAIQMSASELSGKPAAKSELTVLPCKKRAAEPVKSLEETAIVPKPKRSRFKKLKAKLSRGKGDHEQVVHAGNSDVDGHDQEGLNLEQPDASVVQVTGSGPLAPQSMRNCQEQGLALDPNEKEVTGAECVLASPPYVTGKSPNGHFTAPDSNTSNHETPVVRLSSMSCGDTGALVKDTNKVTGVSEVALVVNNSTLGQMEPSSFRPALNQPVESLQAGAGQA